MRKYFSDFRMGDFLEEKNKIYILDRENKNKNKRDGNKAIVENKSKENKKQAGKQIQRIDEKEIEKKNKENRENSFSNEKIGQRMNFNPNKNSKTTFVKESMAFDKAYLPKSTDPSLERNQKASIEAHQRVLNFKKPKIYPIQQYQSTAEGLRRVQESENSSLINFKLIQTKNVGENRKVSLDQRSNDSFIRKENRTEPNVIDPSFYQKKLSHFVPQKKSFTFKDIQFVNQDGIAKQNVQRERFPNQRIYTENWDFQKNSRAGHEFHRKIPTFEQRPTRNEQFSPNNSIKTAAPDENKKRRKSLESLESSSSTDSLMLKAAKILLKLKYRTE